MRGQRLAACCEIASAQGYVPDDERVQRLPLTWFRHTWNEGAVVGRSCCSFTMLPVPVVLTLVMCTCPVPAMANTLIQVDATPSTVTSASSTIPPMFVSADDALSANSEQSVGPATSSPRTLTMMPLRVTTQPSRITMLEEDTRTTHKFDPPT